MYGGNFGGGGSSQMMSMSMSSVCLVSVAAAAVGGLYYMSTQNKPAPLTAAPVDTSTANTPPPAPVLGTAGSISPGQYNVTYGGMNMAVQDTGTGCKSRDVGFQFTAPGDVQAWQFTPVAGRDGYYYVASENKQFSGGCSMKYLTAPANCSGSPKLDQPIYNDRSYWQLVNAGNGQYMLRNSSCQNMRKNSYLSTSGNTQGWNIGTMNARDGSSFSIAPWQSP